jgi:hypothetical protein
MDIDDLNKDEYRTIVEILSKRENVFSVRQVMNNNHGRDYFAGLRVTKRNKATALLTLTLLQTPTLTLILTLT